MPSEAQMWTDHVKPVFKAFGFDPHRVENAISLGMPDVNFTLGWVELKHLNDWPKRERTPVTIRHFTPQQRVWLRRRWAASKNAWLLLRVDTTFMLFAGDIAAVRVGRSTRAGLLGCCLASAEGFEPNVFIPHLKKR